MNQIFADTFYWLALINPKDNWHRRAREVTATLKNVEVVTTDEVLVEVLNFLSARGAKMRQCGVALIDDLMRNPHIRVMAQNRESFQEGFALYRRRADKNYRDLNKT